MSVTHKALHEANSDDEAEADNSQENAEVIVIGTSQGSIHHFILLPGAKWKYFAFEADDSDRILNNTTVFCQLINCGAKIGYSKNTTNLSKHLERHHPTEYSEIQANTDSSDKQPAQCSSKRSGLHKRITDTLQ